MFNIVFNGKNLPDFVRVKAVSTTALPYVSHNILTLSGGSIIDGGTQTGSKIISVDFVIDTSKSTVGTSVFQLTRELGLWLKGNRYALSELYISEAEGTYYLAKVNNSVDVQDAMFIGEGTIEFIVPSGYGYTKRDIVATVSGSTLTTDYTGTIASYPIIEWTPTIDYSGNVTFRYDETGSVFSMTGLFKAGKKVVIDCAKKNVKIDGVVNMKVVQLSSKWFTFRETSTCTLVANVSGTFACTTRELLN